MERTMGTVLNFLRDETGATAIEYALIAGAMGLALIAVMPILATAISDKFSSLASEVTTGAP
jgi:pilus assembly protein Flp/PilA